MIFWFCGGVTLVSALVAAFVRDVRHAILALWMCGLGTGGLLLSLGAEFLAITQWILSTLVAVLLIFYAVMFGEYGVRESGTGVRRWGHAALSLGTGVLFSVFLWIGMRPLVGGEALKTGGDVTVSLGLGALGRALNGEYFLALQLFALAVLLVVVGSGVIARPKSGDS